ncbi:hypothetical protein [Actinomadura sp. B10D3]|uniref:hypothetical protein n=1 Tax=Actinomadura sp. B10D3 TaxID=3153557 RepID=UPI00325D036A
MGELLDAAWGWLVDKVKDWALSTFETLLLWWMSDTAYYVRMTGEKGGVLYSLREHLNWMIAVMAFAGFMVAAFRMAIERKGEPLKAALSHFVELAVIVLTLATAVNLANIAADRYSIWIIQDLMPEGGLAKEWDKGVDSLSMHKNDANFIVACFALFAAFSTVIQFLLMLFRSGVLIVLVGILPVVAASRFTSYGETAYRKCVHWLISFVLFKPVAATIYAAALKLMTSDNEADRLFGLALVAGAVFALPATMRAVMPGVAENNSFFGIRQVGHFAFGGTAVNVGKRTGFWTGLTGIGGSSSGGPSGGAGPGGGGGDRRFVRDAPGPAGGGAPVDRGPTGAPDGGGAPVDDGPAGSQDGSSGAPIVPSSGGVGTRPSGSDTAPSGDLSGAPGANYVARAVESAGRAADRAVSGASGATDRALGGATGAANGPGGSSAPSAGGPRGSH